MAIRSRSARQKKQTRLSFQPLPSSSPSKNYYSTAVQDRLASVRFEGSKTPPTRATRSSTTKKQPALPTPEPSSQPQVEAQDTSPALSASVSSPNDVLEEEQVNNAEANDTDEDEIVLPSSKRRRVSRNEPTETPSRKSTRLNRLETPSSKISLRARRNTSDVIPQPPLNKMNAIGSPETSGDEEDAIITKPPVRRRSTKRIQLDDPFVVSDENYDIDSDPTTIHRLPSSRNLRATSNDFVVDDHEVEYLSSSGGEASLAERRRDKKVKERRRSKREQDELDEDLKDLQDSGNERGFVTEDEVPATGHRTRGGPVTTQRDRTREQIAELKRRRAGERNHYDADSNSGNNSCFDEENGEDMSNINNSRSMHQLSTEESFASGFDGAFQEQHIPQGEDADDDFIVDDEEDDVPGHSRRPQSGIPLAFTSFASSRPRELFVHIVEWLVKNRIAPAFSRDDELYVLSWNKVSDQIKAQAGSRLISSAWNEDFKNAILARPEMQVTYLHEGYDEFFLNCDACNKTNHPARYEFKFAGHAYHKDTLEPVDEDDGSDSNVEDDDDNDDNDKVSYDQAGHLLPSASKCFNLGRFCAANAEMGHKLTHWKYHLNQALLSYLEEQKVLSTESILAREKLNKKKREKEAENIVDMMQETGVIAEMWRNLQNDLEDARFGMEDHIAKNGGRRNKNRIGKVRVNRGEGRIEEWSEGGRVKVVIPSDSEGE